MKVRVQRDSYRNELGYRKNGLINSVLMYTKNSPKRILILRGRDTSKVQRLLGTIIKGLQVYPQRMKENIELSKGLVFSQRVMLALIDKGMSRQKAYALVQRNAMVAWKGNKDFLAQLKNDLEVADVLSAEELKSLFDYHFYLRHIDEIFERLGLTQSQWKGDLTGPGELAPRAI